MSATAIKNLFNVGKAVKRISRRRYNKELSAAIARMDSGKPVSHKEALKELSRW